MKIRTTLWMLGITAMLTSCSQNDGMLPDDRNNETAKVCITLQTSNALTRAQAGGVTNYICEVYKGRNAEGERISRNQSTNGGTFVLTLEKATTYSLLLWADRGGDVYETSNLKQVALKNPKNAGAEAWCNKVEEFVAESGPSNISLRHAVAQVVFNNESALTSDVNELKVTYPASTTLNVSDNSVNETTPPVTRTFTITNKEPGVIATDYVFAPLQEEMLKTLDIQLNNETKKTLPNVPLQMNYTTQIKGSYSNLYNATFNVSSNVEDFSGTDYDFPPNNE